MLFIFGIEALSSSPFSETILSHPNFTLNLLYVIPIPSPITNTIIKILIILIFENFLFPDSSTNPNSLSHSMQYNLFTKIFLSHLGQIVFICLGLLPLSILKPFPFVFSYCSINYPFP